MEVIIFIIGGLIVGTIGLSLLANAVETIRKATKK